VILADVGTTQLTWSLTSDPGLEYGGWKLDSLCLYTLADAPRHYRAQDLSASDDADVVTVRWSSPWVRPLYATALVRRLDGPPPSATDGALLELDLSPTPGEEKVFIDTTLSPGEAAWYAVFAAENAEGLLSEAVLGENLDEGGVPAAPEPEDTAPPEEEPADTAGDPAEVDRPKEPRLSCASSPAPGALGLAVAALSLWRRRRSR
jgi:MYXO-CTERM domain-containing protein